VPPTHRPPRAIALCAALLAVAPGPAAADSRGLARAEAALVAGRPAAADSLAHAALASIERARRPDSLALADAWILGARAVLERGVAPDSLVTARAERAALLLDRLRHAADPHVARAFETAGLARARRGEAGDETAARRWLRAAVARRRALAMPADTALASTLHRLAALERRPADADSARAHLEEALAARERAGEALSAAAARLHRDLGERALDRKDHAAAKRHLDESIRITEAVQGPRSAELVPALQIRSRYENEADRAPLGVPFVERACDIAREVWGSDDERTLHLRGSLASRYLLLGDAALGREVLEDVVARLASRPRTDRYQLAGLRWALAGTCFSTGDSAQGWRVLEQSARDYESVGRQRERGYLYGQETLARRMRASDPARAESMLVRAIGLDRERPGSPDAVTGMLVAGWCKLAADQGRWREVAATADSLIQRFERLGLADRVPSVHGLRWKVLAEQALGRVDEAHRWTLRYSAVQRRITTRTVYGMPDHAAFAFQQRRAEPVDWMLQLATTVGDRATAATWTELARWRGMVRHAFGMRRLAAPAAEDTAVQAARRRWIAAQQDLARHEVAAPGGSHAALRRRVDALRRAYVTAAAGRLSHLPDDSLTIELVAGALRPEQALVRFVELDAGTDSARVSAFVWPAGGDRPSHVTLGPTPPLAAAVARWDAALQTPVARGGTAEPGDERAARAAGARVRALAWESIAPRLGPAREVFVVPAGPLHDLRWAALPWGAREYWAERGPVVRVLEAERELLAPPSSPAPAGVLAFGGIDYDHGTAPSRPVAARFRQSRRDCRDGVPPRFESLPASADEAAHVAAAWPAGAGDARVVSGAAATEAEFKRLAHAHRAIHLATHGFMPHDTCAGTAARLRGVGGVSPLPGAGRAHEPRPSPPPAAGPASVPPPSAPTGAGPPSGVWLAFAGANRATALDDGEDDGLLTPEEVVALDLTGTDWVVLSACYATRGHEEWAREGLSGMRRAFHMAGARTVIGSGWAVGDASTAEWVRALYAARASGATSPGAALQRACATVLAARRAEGRSTHPFHWASFTSTGE
jgi:hypothetical protein